MLLYAADQKQRWNSLGPEISTSLHLALQQLRPNTVTHQNNTTGLFSVSNKLACSGSHYNDYSQTLKMLFYLDHQ